MSRVAAAFRALAQAARSALRIGAFDLGASMGLVLALGFAQNLALARVLGPAGVGHMAVIYSTMTIAALLGTAGLTSSVLRYGAAAPTPAAAWRVFRQSAFACAAISTGVALLAAAFARSRLWIFDPVAGEWMTVAALALPAQALGACANHYLQSRDRMRDKAVVEFVARLVTVAAVLVGAIYWGFAGCAIGYTIGSAAGGAIALARACAGRPRETAEPFVSTRELLRFGLWGVLTNALGLGLVTADIFCVSALAKDSSQVGLYFLAVQIQQIVGIPMRAYLDARFPEMTRLSADPPALRALWRRMRWQLVAVAAAGSAALALCAPFALPFVFGDAYGASALPLAILLLGQIARSFGDAPGRAMFAAGWVEGNFWLSGLSAVLTIAGNVALIPLFGIAGAALGTASAYVLWAIATTGVGNWFDRSRGATMARPEDS
jgi:O-antigen/teichoic acid export membrane protein